MFGKDKENFNEKVLYEARPNIIVYSKGILVAMVVLGVLFSLYTSGVKYIGDMQVYLIDSIKLPTTRVFAIIIFVLILVILLYIVFKLLIWTSIKYSVTESRVIVEKGILLQNTNYLLFNNIQDVSRSQSILGRIFSVGTITLYSAYDGKNLELKNISSPKKVENIIFEKMRNHPLKSQGIYSENGDSPNFNPIHDFDKKAHYRRMDDLDDLELINAQERKRNLRELRRKANSRNNQYKSNNKYSPSNNYNSNYNQNPNLDYSRDSSYHNSNYNCDSNFNQGGSNHYKQHNNSNLKHDDYPQNSNYESNEFGFESATIRESYQRNPDKYFANNYEEFHNDNLKNNHYNNHHFDSNNFNDEFKRESMGDIFRNPKGNEFSNEPRHSRAQHLKSADYGLNYSSKYYEDISDEELDNTINNVMNEDNIKFKQSNRLYNPRQDIQSNSHYNKYVEDLNQDMNEFSDFNSDLNQRKISRVNSSYVDYEGFSKNNESIDSRFENGGDNLVNGHYHEHNLNFRQENRHDEYSNDYHDDGNKFDSHSNNSNRRYSRQYNDKHTFNSSNFKGTRSSKDSHAQNYDDYSDKTSDDEKNNKKSPNDLFKRHSEKFRR